ncbi:hypothetical protein ACHAQH_008188 [Verticillium albo-atrum]
MGRHIVLQVLGLGRDRRGRRRRRLVGTRVPSLNDSFRGLTSNATSWYRTIKDHKTTRIKKKIRIVKAVSSRQIVCRRWVMENDPDREGDGAHPYREEGHDSLLDDEDQVEHTAHELSMIEEVSSDTEKSGDRPRTRMGQKKSDSHFFETYPSPEDDVFVDTGNAALDALRAGNLQNARTYQQASPSGRVVQRRYTGRFSFHGDDDDFAAEPLRQPQSSQPMPSTSSFGLPALRDQQHPRNARRIARGNHLTPTQGPRQRLDIHSSFDIFDSDRQSIVAAQGSLHREPQMNSVTSHSRDNSDASTIREGTGTDSDPMNMLHRESSFNNDEHSIQDSHVNFGIYEDAAGQDSRRSYSTSVAAEALPSSGGSSSMITPLVDNDQESNFDDEIMGDFINVNGPDSWQTTSEVTLPQQSSRPPANVSTHRGPFEWSPGKQNLIRREGSLQFEQPVDTPLLVPDSKTNRTLGGPHGFGDNIYPEEWLEAGELGEGLYPPGNHHGLSDPFSSSSVAARENHVVEGIAGLRVTVVDHTFTPEALRRGQPDAQAVAQRNRLVSPFYNRLRQLAANPRHDHGYDDTFELGRPAGLDTGDVGGVATIATEYHVLPEAVESPTALVLQEYETSSDTTGQGEQREPSVAGSDHPTHDQESMEKSQQVQNPTSRDIHGFNTRDWSDYGSALVDYAPEKAAPKIPGCTAGQASKTTWKLTGPTLRAYNAMRGSRMTTGDPLGTWIAVKMQEGLINQSCESNGRESNGKKKAAEFDVNELQAFTADIAETLQEWPGIDKQARQEFASVPRPQYQHLNPPDGFKYPPLLASSINGIASESYDKNFQDEYDISDDEGDPRDGRISPCTFRALAEGCARWAEPGEKPIEMPLDTERLRPQTPPGGSQPQLHADRMAHKFTWQRDVEDGDQLSPAYSLPSSPSILYTPPGLNPAAKMRNWTTNMYDRMDPLMAKRLRNVEEANENDADEAAAPPSTPPTASSENMPYTQSEVAEALTSPQSRTVAGIPPSAAEIVIAQRWQTAGLWRANEEELSRRCEGELTPHLTSMRTELLKVRAGVDEILAAREAEASSKAARRNRRILRQVSGHLKEVKYQLKLRGQRLGETKVLSDRLELEIKNLEEQIQKEVERAGLSDVAAVRAEVGEEAWGRLVRDAEAEE